MSTYMDVHKTLRTNTSCVFIYELEESAFNCVCCCCCCVIYMTMGDMLGFSTFLKTCKTFNPCCLKFTSLSTANSLALNEVQCSILVILSRFFQTVGAGMCGFRTGTVAQKQISKIWAFMFRSRSPDGSVVSATVTQLTS